MTQSTGTQKTNWRALAEGLAAISVVLGLIFVAYELRLSRESQRIDNVAQSSQDVIEVRSLIAENSEIWVKGCLGEELSALERVAYVQILEAWNFMYFSLWLRSNTVGFATSSSAGAQTVGLNLYRFDGLRENWRNLQSNSPNEIAGTPSGWNEAVEDQISRFREMQAPEDADVSLCGR